jgi:hypothetical protein
MGRQRTFDIVCPCCQARLRVDADLRAVISHQTPPKQPQISDLGQAARALRDKESHREEQFQKSVQAERKRAKLLERKFEEAFQKAKDEPLTPPPPRDIDLD